MRIRLHDFGIFKLVRDVLDSPVDEYRITDRMLEAPLYVINTVSRQRSSRPGVTLSL
jgi:hypothetical protein